ncbi:hypothetical protein MMC20_000919 [Loxospora ochrophaea]|nr:hypothetical protein [Loxospora ochrophaea]
MVAENGLTQREVEANEPLLQYQTQEPEDYVCCWDFQETRGYHDLKPDPKSRSALTSPLQRVPSTTFPSPEENCGTLRDDGNEDDWDFLHNASSGISSYDLTEDPDVASGEHKNFQQTYTQVENDSLNLNSNLYPKACFSASSCHGHHLEPSYSSERRSQAKADLQNRPILRRHAKALRHQLRRLRQAWDELRSEKATLRHERAALHHEKTRLQSGRRRFPNHNRQQPTDFSSNSSDSSGSNGPASYNGDSERSTTRTLSPPSSPSRHRHPPPSVPSPSPLQAYNTAWSTLLSSPSSSTPPSLPYPTPTLTPSPLLFPPSHPLTPPSWRTFPHLHTHPIVVYNTVRFFAAAFGLVVIPASSLTSTGKDTDSSRHPFEVVNADESAVGPLRKQMDREVGRWHEDRLRARGVIISSGEEVDGEGERERRHGAVCERDIVKGVWEGVRALRAWARESS